MKLEFGNFHVKDIKFADKTSYSEGILSINKEEAIAVLNKDGGLKNVDLKVAHPGESVRMVPVKAIVEPRCHLDGRATFPGYTGPVVPAGEGEVYALKDMSVVAVGTKSVHGYNGMLDMTGPGAEQSYFYSRLINLVILAENANPDEDAVGLENLHFAKAACCLGEYLAQAVKELEPDEKEVLEWNDVSEKKLPRVAFFNQLCNIPNWLKDITYYGFDLTGVPTTVIKPLEFLDGAIANAGGSLISNVMRATYSMQNAPIIKRLLEEHGKTIDFVGVVLQGHIEPIDQKQRYAQMFVSLAQILKCDAVIGMESHCGNVDVDFMLTMAGMEDAGIKTVAVFAENDGRDGKNPGKTYMDSKVDAIVTTGNTCQVYELPAMDVVYGDLNSIGRDPYWGAWRDDAAYGPSLREDGSVIVDAHMFMGHDGLLGWSDKTVKDF